MEGGRYGEEALLKNNVLRLELWKYSKGDGQTNTVTGVEAERELGVKELWRDSNGWRLAQYVLDAPADSYADIYAKIGREGI